MSIAVGSNLAAMQTVSQDTRAIWDTLRLQISPFTSVVTIDGYVFNSWNAAEKQWISAQYSAIVNVNVIYVQDTQMFRVFLARADIFPPGSLLPVAPGNVTILLHPTMLGNALPAVEPPRPDPRPAKVERSNTAKSSKILRPPNAFILYRKAHHEAVKAAHPGIHNNQISVILGTQWQQEDAAVRAQYKAQAVQLKQEHMMKYPDYQYQPRKTSELKRRMTKKKAAALNQNEAPNQNIFGIGSLPSDHDFSRVSGKWSDSNGADDTNPPNVMPGYNTAALFDQVHLHNSQQELNQDLEESLPEVFAGDNQYAELVSPEDYNIPWQAIEKHYLGSGNDDVFEEFINSGIWAGTGTST